MEALTQKARQQRLAMQLKKSLSTVRLGNGKKLTASDKSKIKKVAVDGLQRYLKAEIKRVGTKTYDWIFYLEDSQQLYHIEVDRNNLGHNRYFIVDHEHIPIGTEFSFGSTTGIERRRQFDIASREIGDIISSSKKLFADMMRITVSEKEDAKIYRAFDNVDEKSIFMVTIGLPVAIIASAEAIPLMILASKSTAASTISTSIGKAFAVNSGRQMAINGGLEFGSQYLSNGIAKNDWALSNIDIPDVVASTIFGKGGDVILGSAFDGSYNKGFRLNSFSDFSENIVTGGLKFKGSKVFDVSLGTPLGNLSKSFGTLTNFGGQLTIQTLVESFKKETKDNLKDGTR